MAALSPEADMLIVGINHGNPDDPLGKETLRHARRH